MVEVGGTTFSTLSTPSGGLGPHSKTLKSCDRINSRFLHSWILPHVTRQILEMQQYCTYILSMLYLSVNDHQQLRGLDL